MLFFGSVGPNPRVVRMTMIEKGFSLPEHIIDIRGGENRTSPYNVDVNPLGQVPALRLDDGTVLTDSIAIAQFLDDTMTGPTIFGSDARSRAAVTMWLRRIDSLYCQSLISLYRSTIGLTTFSSRVVCSPQAADDFKVITRQGERIINELLADGRPFIGGSAFTISDIVLFCFVDFAHEKAEMNLARESEHLERLYRSLKSRTSAQLTAEKAYG